MIRSKISFVSGYTPDNIVTSEEVEKMINKSDKLLPEKLIEQKFGVKQRRFAEKSVQSSDLASYAGLKIDRVGFNSP